MHLIYEKISIYFAEKYFEKIFFSSLKEKKLWFSARGKIFQLNHNLFPLYLPSVVNSFAHRNRNEDSLVTLTNVLKIVSPFIRHHVDSAYALVSKHSLEYDSRLAATRYGAWRFPVIPHGKYRVLWERFS